MVFENRNDCYNACECVVSSPETTPDGFTFCNTCGVELESIIFDNSRAYTEENVVVSNERLPRRLMYLERQTCTTRFRAMQAALELVKKIHPEMDIVQKIALEYVELGWDESNENLKAEPHLCRFGHPHGVEYVAAACLYNAQRDVGICSERMHLVAKCLETTGAEPIVRKMNRTLKSLNKRIRLKKNQNLKFRNDDPVSFVRPLTEGALSKVPELSPIRKELIIYGENYCRENTVRSGNPLNAITALAYVLQRTAGLGLKREDVRTAFGATTTMGHFIPEMKQLLQSNSQTKGVTA